MISKEKLCAPIAEAMRKYREDGALAFHTPGHKQGLGAHPLLRELVTEQGLREEVSLMEELDDLHEPTMCIAEAQKLAAELYGAGQAYFCINGTTGAVQAMLLGTLSAGDTVLVPRNAHRSIIGGLILSGARPVYLQPEIDARLGIPTGIGLENLQAAVAAYPEAKAAVLVYPTYYGTTVDLGAIADFLHSRDMLLLVDEAHGPHLPFSEELPQEAIAAGADAAALSTHKILGSMTQTSMLLVNKKTKLDRTGQGKAQGKHEPLAVHQPQSAVAGFSGYRPPADGRAGQGTCGQGGGLVAEAEAVHQRLGRPLVARARGLRFAGSLWTGSDENHGAGEGFRHFGP